MLPQTLPISFYGVTEPFRLYVMQPFQKLSSWWLGRAPQHPLSRPSSIRGVKPEYRFKDMQTFNNVQMNGWSCSPNTVQLKSQCWVNFSSGWREAFQKHSKVWLGHASRNTAQFFFHSVEEPFRLEVMQLLRKHSSWWLGRAPQHALSRPSPFYGVKHLFFCCCADFQQRSNERLLVLPQTRSSSIHGVESTFRPDGVKLFKNIPNLGWIVLPQTRPSSFHDVEEPFRLDVMQPFQKHSSW